MEKNKPNNPSAFPEIAYSWDRSSQHSDIEIVQYSTGGMTLRDYFAAKALSAIIKPGLTANYVEIMCVDSYKIADAMLKERMKYENK